MFRLSKITKVNPFFHAMKSSGLLVLLLGIYSFCSLPVNAQESSEELKVYIKALQIKLEEQNKILEQQKLLILEQSKLPKQQNSQEKQTVDPESTPPQNF